MIATLVNFDALWKIVAVGFGVGAGAVVVWSTLLIAVTRARLARERGEIASLTGYGALIGACGLAFAAALVAGFIAMTHK